MSLAPQRQAAGVRAPCPARSAGRRSRCRGRPPPTRHLSVSRSGPADAPRGPGRTRRPGTLRPGSRPGRRHPCRGCGTTSWAYPCGAAPRSGCRRAPSPRRVSRGSFMSHVATVASSSCSVSAPGRPPGVRAIAKLSPSLAGREEKLDHGGRIRFIFLPLEYAGTKVAGEQPVREDADNDGDMLAEQGDPPRATASGPARDLRGLTQAEVVARMEAPISTAALSQIESGRSRPTRGDVGSSPPCSRCPRASSPSRGPPGPGETEAVTFFGISAPRPSGSGAGRACLAVLLEDLIACTRAACPAARCSIPSIEVALDADSRNRRHRPLGSQRLELGDEPIRHVVRELERHGVAVARLSMGHRLVDGFSVHFARRPLVLLARRQEQLREVPLRRQP